MTVYSMTASGQVKAEVRHAALAFIAEHHLHARARCDLFHRRLKISEVDAIDVVGDCRVHAIQSNESHGLGSLALAFEAAHGDGRLLDHAAQAGLDPGIAGFE